MIAGDKPIYCIIAGSRKFHDFELMRVRLDGYFQRAFEKNIPIIIISGTAGGADQLGERYAELRGLECIRMPAEWNKYGRSAGYKRNVEMAKVSTHLVAFWDGNTHRSGTNHMINISKEHHLISRIVMFESVATPKPTVLPKGL